MISFIRELAAAPFMLLFWGLNAIGFAQKVRFFLIKIIWKISGDVEWTHWLIVYTRAIEGIEAARGLAHKLFEQYRDARIALFIGGVEFNQDKNADAAKQWIQRAEQMAFSHLESVVYLKLMLREHFPEFSGQQFVDEVLSRRDLSMSETRWAMFIKIIHHIRKKQWQEADFILDTMLKVESLPKIHILKWITSAAQQKDAQSQIHLAAAAKTLPAESQAYWKAFGMFHLGRMDQAKTYFKQAVESGADEQEMCFFSPEFACLKNTETPKSKQARTDAT